MKTIDKNYQLIGIDEWIVEKGNAVLGTTLGSCVSLCLWDPKTLTGGLNHFLMPHRVAPRDRQNPRVETFYQHEIIERLIDHMLTRGIAPGDIRALVVGGAEAKNDYYQIGEKNLQAAVTLLREKGIDNIRISGGGPYSRRIHFHVGEGRVVIRKLDLSQSVRKEAEEIVQL